MLAVMFRSKDADSRNDQDTGFTTMDKFAVRFQDVNHFRYKKVFSTDAKQLKRKSYSITSRFIRRLQLPSREQ